MYHVISTQGAFKDAYVELEAVLPALVLERLKVVLKTLDECYGADRDMDTDLGGYCVVFSQMGIEEQREYETILLKCHMQKEEYEYRDGLVEGNGMIWIEEVFILSTDYGIVFFYPKEIEKGADVEC